jgi:hypothetical protein
MQAANAFCELRRLSPFKAICRFGVIPIPVCEDSFYRLRISLVHNLGNQMPNLLPAVDQLFR